MPFCTVKLARAAMATRFEIVLHGHDPGRLRAAGEEALDEIERWENRLSLYRSSTEIAHVNARAAQEPVRVSPQVFALLSQAKLLGGATGGAFDITLGPLVKCWGFMDGIEEVPSAEKIQAAQQCVGLALVELDAADYTVKFLRQGVKIDLGAIGKGYAIERASELLREAGVTSALLHGGTSSVCAIGHPPDQQAWLIALEEPSDAGKKFIARVPLKDDSLSVSAVWGRAFEKEGETFGHVLDPRTGRPANNAVMAAVALPSTTETDALSTALLVEGPRGLTRLAGLRREARALVVSQAGLDLTVESHGIDLWSGPDAPHPAAGSEAHINLG